MADTKDSMISIQSSPEADPSKPSPTNKDIMQFLEKMKKQQCTKGDLSKLETAMSSKIDEVKTHAVKNSGKIQQLSQRMDRIETVASKAAYNNELHKQRELKNNICIMGIPSFDKESPLTTVTTVFNAINCKVSSSGIVSAYRTRGKASLIVVKLVNYDDKIKILNAKTKKAVRVSEIAVCDPSVANNFVYINNHVTPFFGKLLKEGRSAIKNNQIHSCWLTSSGCMLKVKEGGDSLIFSSIEQLHEIINAQPSSSETPQQKKRGKPDDIVTDSTERKSKHHRSANKKQ